MTCCEIAAAHGALSPVRAESVADASMVAHSFREFHCGVGCGRGNGFCEVLEVEKGYEIVRIYRRMEISSFVWFIPIVPFRVP